jgi:dTDP-4-amino-4,6-dideoxy-D-galactose acyltransferase
MPGDSFELAEQAREVCLALVHGNDDRQHGLAGSSTYPEAERCFDVRKQYHGVAVSTLGEALMPLTSPTLSVGKLLPLIRDSLPWSPLDFIRGIATAGDRAVYFASILRELDPANDLRLACPIAPDSEVAVVAERLPWDSSFFGYDVARLHGVFPLQPGGYRADADYLPALNALIQLARSRGIRYLFAVLDARDLPTLRALSASGFMLIETRIYFHRSLRSYQYRRRYRCRPATATDLDGLMGLAQSVENPFDRFNSDPFIGREEARRLIATWIRASVVGGFADATLIPDQPNPGAL